MTYDVTIPTIGESVTEALVSQWLKGVGDSVSVDEPIVELETDKVAVELPSPISGVLVELVVPEGGTANVGDVIARIEEGAGAGADAATATVEVRPIEAPTPPSDEPPHDDGAKVMPAAQRALDEHGLTAQDVTPSGPGGRLLKEDVERHSKRASAAPEESGTAPSPLDDAASHRVEEVVAMTPIRRRIAERLVGAQQQAALLTTFNEVDLSSVISLRKQYQDAFVKRHGIKLGFMSFFVKASIDALREFPQINAQIDGTDIVYRNYYDIGIAVSTDRGLVVPVVRNAERLSFAEIEQQISDYGTRARDGKIRLSDLEGGTFTITNGGIFGSMLSTPIINPPQSGVLGLHAIQDRPVAEGGEVVIRPVMYVALTYDHRIVDGREAVTFLRRIKEAIEDPSRMLLEV